MPALVAEFLVTYVLAVQHLAGMLARAVGRRVATFIRLAVKLFVIVVWGHYLFGAVGSFIALFVESGKEWWWFFWEFLEMGVKSVLFTLFLLAVHIAVGMAQERRNAG